MTFLPFGHTVQVWRRHRGLTQQELASRAQVPRSNLSAIERGWHEVSLGTLRALATALGVRPGILVDGVPPASAGGVQPPLSREAVERIADAVAFHRPRHRARGPARSHRARGRDVAPRGTWGKGATPPRQGGAPRVTQPAEQVAVEALRILLRHRTLAARRQWRRPRTGRRRVLAAWIRLKSLYGRPAIQMLADRILERQGAHDPTSH